MLFHPLHKNEYYVVVVFSFGIASVEPRAVDEDGENRFEAAATKQLLLLQCFLIYVMSIYPFACLASSFTPLHTPRCSAVALLSPLHSTHIIPISHNFKTLSIHTYSLRFQRFLYSLESINYNTFAHLP